MKNTQKSYFNFLWKQHHNYGILVLIAQLLVGVVPTIFYLQDARNSIAAGYSMSYDHPFMIMIAVVTMISAMIVPFISFGYLFKGSNLDTYFSLPVPKAYLFVKELIFSYVLVLVPTIIVTIVNVVLIETSNVPLTSIDYGLVIRQLLMILVASSVFILPSLLAILATGDLLNAILHAGVVHGIPFFLYGVLQMATWGFNGFTYFRASENPKNNIDLIIPLINFFRSLTENAEWKVIIANVIWGVIALVLVIKMLRLYKRYKLDNLNSAPQSKYFYTIVSYIAGVLAFTFVFSNDFILKYDSRSFIYGGFGIENYIVIFAVAFVVYYIVRLIQNKGFPKFLRTIVNYVIIVAIALVISLGLVGIHTFASNRIPRARAIDRVDLYVVESQYESDAYATGEDGEALAFTRSYFGDYRQLPYDIYSSESAESIEFVRELHEAKHDDFNDYAGDRNNPHIVKIVYYKNDRVKLMREYVISEEQLEDLKEEFGEPVEVHREDPSTTIPTHENEA